MIIRQPKSGIEPPDLLPNNVHEALQEEKRHMLANCIECNQSGYVGPGEVCDHCLGKYLMKYRIACSNIPREYQKVKWNNFVMQTDSSFLKTKKYASKLSNALKKGIGVHLYSAESSSGKTLLGNCILHEAIAQGYYVWFTSMEELIEQVKDSFKSNELKARVEWAMFGVDFLFIDELGKFKNTEWRDSKTNDFFQRRLSEELPVISTDNLSLEQLKSKHPGHIIARLEAVQMEIAFPNKIEYRLDVKRKNIMKELMQDE